MRTSKHRGAETPSDTPAERYDVMRALAQSCDHLVGKVLAEHPAARALAITSALPGEGRSTVAMCLAGSHRLAGEQGAVVLEFDGRADVERIPTDLSHHDLASDLQWITDELAVLSLVPGTGSQWVSDLAALVMNLQAKGFAVVGDLPPMPPHGDADRYLTCFAMTVMVVQAGRTPIADVRAATQLLPDPAVVVLNRTKSSIPRWLRPRGGR